MLDAAFAEDCGAAARGIDQPEQRPDSRRFAGAVRSDKTEDLALLDINAYVGDASCLAVILP